MVDEISFLKFNPEKIKFLKSLSDWVSKSLDNAYAGISLRRKDLFDEELQAFNYRYALHKLKDEQLNAQVSGRPSSILLIKTRNFDEIAPEERVKIKKTLIQTIASTLRASDTVTTHLSEDLLVAVLPGSDLKGAGIVQERLKEKIKTIVFHPSKKEKSSVEVDIESRLVDAGIEDIASFLA
jgi:GGDEF domain-containing protein